MTSKLKTHALVLSCMLIVGGEALGGAAIASCTPAQSAEITAVENVILADVLADKTFEQIQTDVAKLLAGQPGADVVAILDEALQLLIDLGKIPASFLAKAKAMEAKAHALRGLRAEAACRADAGT